MEDDRLLGEFIINHKKTHSRKLMPMIRELMDSLELKPEDLDLYAVSIGPGSFTGLRIGITTVKAMAYASQKPVVGIPTLDALAMNIPFSRFLVVPMMDARNQQVYTAVYSTEDGGLTNVSGYLGVPVPELMDILKGKNRKALFLGDAAPLHREYLMNALGDCAFAPGHLMLQKASSVAQAAYAKVLKGEASNCFDLVPFYLRKSQAEREYDRRHGNCSGET